MQAAQRVELQTMLSGNCTSVTMSEIANRPPDFSNRPASANTFDLSVARLMTPLLITKSAKPVGQRSLLDIALDVGHIEEAVAVAQPLRFGSLLVRHVDADNFAAGTHLQRGDERVHPRAAAEVHNGFARFWIGQVKIVADAGKRFDCIRRYAVEISWRVAEALGHRAAHLEVEFSIRIFGDAPIHRLHLGFEFLRVERSDRGHGQESSSKLLIVWIKANTKKPKEKAVSRTSKT